MNNGILACHEAETSRKIAVDICSKTGNVKVGKLARTWLCSHLLKRWMEWVSARFCYVSELRKEPVYEWREEFCVHKIVRGDTCSLQIDSRKANLKTVSRSKRRGAKWEQGIMHRWAKRQGRVSKGDCMVLSDEINLLLNFISRSAREIQINIISGVWICNLKIVNISYRLSEAHNNW